VLGRRISELRRPIKAPRDPQGLLFHVKQLSGRFAFPNTIFKRMQKQQKRHYRVTMSQFSHLYLTSSQGRFVSKEYKWILEPNNLKKWRSVYGWGDSEKTGVFCLTIGEVFRCFDQVDLVDLTTDIEKQGIDLKIKRIANGERYSRTDVQTIQVAINCETASLRAPLELPLSQKSKQMPCWIRFLLFSCLWCILVVMALVVGFYFDPSGLVKFTNDTDESKSILTAFYDWNLVWIISPN